MKTKRIDRGIHLFSHFLAHIIVFFGLLALFTWGARHDCARYPELFKCWTISPVAMAAWMVSLAFVSLRLTLEEAKKYD